MAHKRHANFLQDAGFHQASVEGVAEIVKTDVAKCGVFQRRFPRAFHDADRPAFEADYQPRGFAVSKEVFVQAVSSAMSTIPYR